LFPGGGALVLKFPSLDRDTNCVCHRAESVRTQDFQAL
jgi:hypothetical protein